MATTIKATRQVVEDYQRLFVNRRAYTMQSMRPHPETGRHYYFRPSKKGTDVPLTLTDETIRQHLEGKITVGLYAINPATQRCKWVAIDADYKNSVEDLLKLQYHLTQDRVEPALEMSRRGGHLWIFLATPLLAKECRIYIHNLALRLGVPVKGAGLVDGIEVFPKHDAIGTGEFGNAIRGPLGIHRGANRRFWFYGADYTLEDQIAYLNRLRKVTEEELRRFIATKGTDLRTVDYAASPECDQRWKAAATGNNAPVSGHSRSLGSGFVRKGQRQSWHGSADVLFARRGGSQDTEAVSPSGARDNRGGSLRRMFPLPLCQAAAEGRGTGARRTCHSLTWLNGRSE